MATMQVTKRHSWVDQSSSRWFYAAVAFACILISFVSFVPSLANPSHRLGSLTWLTAVHATAFCLWLLIFLAQTLLVQTGRIALHRTLGTASLFLAGAMVVIGYRTAVIMTRRGFDLSGDLNLSHDPLGPVGQIIFPLLDIFEFGILVAVGFFYRRRAAIHKRIMLFATLALLPAPFAHLIGHNPTLQLHPIVIVPMVFVSLVASGVYDLVRFQRIHPVSLWLGLVMFALDNLCAVFIGPSGAWHRFANWLVS